MTLLVTHAVVLHVFPYLESSRIVRLATRERGVVSVLARGARRPKSRFGSALDLFAEGVAQIVMRPSRDLQTLTSFEATRSRASLGADLGRFSGAAAIAELVLRCAAEENSPVLFDGATDALDAIAAATADLAGDATLGGAWRLVAALGFAPALDSCASCHADIPLDEPARFSTVAGGVLCAVCGTLDKSARSLPAEALRRLRGFVAGEESTAMAPSSRRAHQRLLREFIQEHIGDGRALRAYDSWERGWDSR